MLLAAFLKWWYGPGWAQQLRKVETRLKNIAGMFSVDILLRTLFSPWKQIVSTARRDQSLGDKFRAYLDNQISRFVGFGVRILVLLTAVLSMVFVAIVGAAGVILWPFVPLLPLFLILMSAGVLRL